MMLVKLTLMTARPIATFWYITGRDMSIVSSVMFDGLCSVVSKVVRIYSFPPFPPLPVTETLFNVAVWSNELMPKRAVHFASKFRKETALALQT